MQMMRRLRRSLDDDDVSMMTIVSGSLSVHTTSSFGSILRSSIVRDRLPGVMTVKGDRNPATEVDYAVERTVREFLLAEASDVRFLGEEDGEFGRNDRVRAQ